MDQFLNPNRYNGSNLLSLSKRVIPTIGKPLGIGVGYSPQTYSLPFVYASAYEGSPVKFQPYVKPPISPLQRSKAFKHRPGNTRNPTL